MIYQKIKNKNLVAVRGIVDHKLPMEKK